MQIKSIIQQAVTKTIEAYKINNPHVPDHVWKNIITNVDDSVYFSKLTAIYDKKLFSRRKKLNIQVSIQKKSPSPGCKTFRSSRIIQRQKRIWNTTWKPYQE